MRSGFTTTTQSSKRNQGSVRKRSALVPSNPRKGKVAAKLWPQLSGTPRSLCCWTFCHTNNHRGILCIRIEAPATGHPREEAGKLDGVPLLLYHNAPAHSSNIAQAAIRECGFELLPHPPYSPDMAASDFHLFPNLKKALRGMGFPDDDSLEIAVRGWLED